MPRMPLRTILAVASAVAVGLPSAAHAQTTPSFEVSGGYQLLHMAGNVDETLTNGWYGDVAANMGRSFSAVFRVGGNYKTIEETETFEGITASATADLKVHEFLGGARFNARTSRITPFAQVLVGGVNGSAKFKGSVTGDGEQFFATSGSDSSTDLGLAIGGGATFHLTPRAGLRVGTEYLRVFSGENDVDALNTFRFAAGIVFPF